ncbi:AsmA family protein [Simkania negevensis]|uniref:Uncharacterized protein n=1 Tax=Simkania negevensis (strain ATCC VR-1471 / DSM 27360 / Z) TaxID=331113 RepID=F8L8C0_SIMNZ|nr:hypothetical protein [Simkania negevensis]CCB89043.1 hypothetical protein SNE_A11660 [Simkania negevensis Z]
MKKILIITFAALICFVGLLVLFLPSMLSSHAGKNFLIHRIQQDAQATVQISDVSLSWTRPQKIEGFHFEKKGDVVLSFESLTLDITFWNLLFRQGSLGDTKLVKPELILATNHVASPPKISNGSSKKKKQKNHRSFWKNLSGQVTLEDGLFAVQKAGKDLIRIDDVDFLLGMSSKTFPLAVKGSGKTISKERLGSFQVKGAVESKVEVIDLESAEALQISGEANLNNFPVATLDALSSLMDPEMRGIFTDAFGDTLNLDLLFSKAGEGQNFSAQLRSPLMEGSLFGSYQKGLIQLRDTLKLNWTLKPRLLQALAANSPLVLIGDCHTEIEVSQLSLLFKNMKLYPRIMAIAGQIKMQQGAFALAKTRDSLLLDSLDVSFNTTNLGELFHSALNTSYRFSSFPPSKVQATSSLKELFSQKDWITKFALLDLSVRNMPTALVDRLTSEEENLQKWIGSNFDFSLKRFDQEGEKQFLISGNSPLFNLSSSQFTSESALVLKKPTSFTYQVTPSVFTKLAYPMMISGELQNLTLPIGRFKEAALKMQLTGQDVQFSNFFGLGAMQLPQLDLQLNGKLDQQLEFKGKTRFDFAAQTWGQTLFGQDVAVNASGILRMKKELEISPMQVTFDSSKFKSTVEGSLASGAFILKNPVDISFLLQLNEVNSILSKQEKIPLLAESATANFQIQPGSFPMRREAVKGLDLKIAGSIPTLKMVERKTKASFSLENVILNYDLSGKRETSRLQLDAKALLESVSAGSLKFLAVDNKGNFNPLKHPSQTQLTLNRLSTQIVDAFLSMNATLPQMIGDWIDLKFDITKQGKNGEFNTEVKSPYLSLIGSFQADDKFRLKNNRNPLIIDWNISEEGVLAFKRWKNPTLSTNPAPFVIKDRASLKFNVSALELPLTSNGELFPNVDMNLYRAIFNADLRVDSLALEQQKTKEVTQLDRFDLSVVKENAPGPLSFKMQGNVSPEGSRQSGQIRGEGSLDDFLTPQGTVDLEDITASIHAQIQHLPTVFLDAISNIKDPSGIPPSAVLGDIVNASFDAGLIKENGKLSFDVDGTNCRAKMNGTVANGYLYLNEPLQAAMTISPKMNEILSRSAKIVVASLKNPIALFVSEKGFSVPIKDLALRSSNLSYGMIDFGQITCRNTGSASDISGIFKMEGNQNLISLWFAPMEFSIKSGLMHVDRTEILYNRAYQVALWGDINFVRRYVDMILGLTAQSLRAALGISGLDSNYVLQVPVKGPFGNVQVDKGTATSRIALLIARKQVAPKAGVWGQVFGAIGGMADDQSDVPPPKPPFPWQNILNLQEKTTSEKDLKDLYKKKAKAYQKEVKKYLKPK